jgi:hypothetical protein
VLLVGELGEPGIGLDELAVLTAQLRDDGFEIVDARNEFGSADLFDFGAERSLQPLAQFAFRAGAIPRSRDGRVLRLSDSGSPGRRTNIQTSSDSLGRR